MYYNKNSEKSTRLNTTAAYRKPRLRHDGQLPHAPGFDRGAPEHAPYPGWYGGYGGYGAGGGAGGYGAGCAGCSTWPLDVMIEPGGRATLLGGAGIGCMGMLANMAPPWGCDWLSRTMDIFCGVMAGAGLGFIYMCVSLRHVLLDFHRKSVSGWTCFRLGFVYHFPRSL